MAIFYMNVQIIGRSTGRTATGAAAYRAGERIADDRTGLVFDYTRRHGEIETAIYSPADSPAWAGDRAALWNAVEKAERRCDAQVAREIIVAFPKEMSKEQQRELIAGYVQEQFVARGMVADVAIHRNPGNPHAHIMLTMRGMGPEGLSAKKNREWNKPEMLETWRERWAAHSNRALERAGREERIDHRSLAEQGAERLPQVHLGPDAAALERRDVATEKGNHNRLVAEHNAVVLDLQQAREEKARLETQQVVDKRYSDRIDAGWAVDHATALAQLEYYVCGGRQLSWRDVGPMADAKRRDLDQVRAEILAIRQEDRRLLEVTEILGYRRDAAAKVEKLQSPLASVKRWFSDAARREYQLAKDQLDRLDERAKRLGTGSETELQLQRAACEEHRSQMPALEEKVASLAEGVARVAKALEGFTRESERDQDHLNRERRKRAPETDRGR